MRIWAATAPDLPFVVVANSALATETEGKTLEPVLIGPGVQAVLDDSSLGHYYLAEIDGQFIGQITTTFEWSDWRNGLFLWIQSVCGIRLYVDRANARAQEVYVRMGMHRTNYGVMETVHRGPESREVT